MNNNSVIYEDMISIKRFAVNFLRKWRVVVIAALIGAVLLGAYQAVSMMNPVALPAMTEQQRAEAEVRIGEIGAQIAALEGSIASEEEMIKILEDAIVANELSLQSNQQEESYIKKQIARKEETVKQLQNLAETYSTMMSQLLEEGYTGEEGVSDVLNLGTKLYEAQNRITVAEQEMDELEKRILGLDGQNDVLQAENETRKEAIKEREKTIADIETDIEKLQKDIADIRVAMDATYIPGFSLSAVVIRAVIGAFLGAIAVFAYLLLAACTDKYLRDARELEVRFGLFSLGRVHLSQDGAQKKRRCRIDRWIDKLDGQSSAAAAQEYALTAAKLEVLSRGQKILLTGTVAQEVLDKVSEEIRKYLPEDCQIQVKESPLYHADAMKLLADHEVLLVEQLNHTQKKEIVRLVEFLNKSESRILGVVSV